MNIILTPENMPRLLGGRLLLTPIAPDLSLTDENGDVITEDGTGEIILEDAA